MAFYGVYRSDKCSYNTAIIQQYVRICWGRYDKTGLLLFQVFWYAVISKPQFDKADFVQLHGNNKVYLSCYLCKVCQSIVWNPLSSEGTNIKEIDCVVYAWDWLCHEKKTLGNTWIIALMTLVIFTCYSLKGNLKKQVSICICW